MAATATATAPAMVSVNGEGKMRRRRCKTNTRSRTESQSLIHFLRDLRKVATPGRLLDHLSNTNGFQSAVFEVLGGKLAGDQEKTKKRTKKSKPKVTEGSQPPQVKMPQKPIPSRSNTQTGSITSTGWPHQSALFLPVPPPPVVSTTELDAIRSVLQESENVLEKLQKKENDMVQEVTQRAKELHEKEFKLPYQKPIPCIVEKDACLECYKEHVKDPLKCSNVVKSYSDCVLTARQQQVPPVGE
ncbi:hypothetical protein H6P81_020691 [Aristolochia fimbriata]|uniref:Uncharacterized protein n=1 Tax=Aristolochia fimbriata TaxID=158543 RepID=A0AAV7DWA6_ARIFI|nr:hypothetical protein H6P81_020691 [Aristolochia fimbriata]